MQDRIERIERLPRPVRVSSLARGIRHENALSSRKGNQLPTRYHLMDEVSRSFRYGFAASSDRMRRKQANKEIIRRALTPPIRRPSLRWWNFRPRPSRLSNMSLA